MQTINPRSTGWLLVLLGYLVFAPQLASANQYQIVYNKPANLGSGYMQGLLKLALDYSGKPYTYTTTDETYSRPRQMETVRAGSLSLMWGGTSEQMEQDFIPVRIDAYRGLMSHRIFIIRQGDQAKFDNIRTLEDLKKNQLWSGAQLARRQHFGAGRFDCDKNHQEKQFVLYGGWWAV